MNQSECTHDYRPDGGMRHAIYRPGYTGSGADFYTCRKCGHKRDVKIEARKLGEPTITDEDLDKIDKG